jgi:enediyne biosynthesis protein E4
MRMRISLIRPAVLALLFPICSNAPAANLEWSQATGFRSAALPIPKEGKAGFTLLPPSATGINFTNILSDEKIAENQLRLNGSGVACGDVDGDGWCDIYLCGLENGNRLYRNLGGWKFEDVTAAAGVGCTNQYSTGAVFADVDGNGTLDLLVNGIGVGTRLFLNDGKGHFHEATHNGLVAKYGATTLALGDVNGDGYLDLYVADYRTTTIRTTGLPLLKINGKLSVRPEDSEDYELSPQGLIIEHGEPDFFYLNDGHGHFQPQSWTNGLFLDENGQRLNQAPRDWGLCAAFRDLNGDRAPDLYVCNDFDTPDRIWINDGRGHFRAIPRVSFRNTSTFSMAVDFGDINRDGFDDVFVADMLDQKHQMRMVEFQTMEPSAMGLAGVLDRPQVNRNTLQLNRGDGTYAEVAYYAGIESSGWTWSSIFLDVDLDGYEDLIMSTGYPFDTQDLDATERIRARGPMGKNMKYKILMYPRLQLPRRAFRNCGDLTFKDFSAQWGFNDEGVSHGMALADLDNDGDLDVIMNSLNGPARIYRNDCTAPRIAVRLKGLAPNTQGIGAKILVRGGAVPLQSQEMMCGGRYLSGDDNIRTFAAGSGGNMMSFQVLWRSGKDSLITNALANRIYEIDEAAAQSAAPQHTNPPAPLFEDVSQLLAHDHHDEPFDDFARQKLLPKKLSQLGPGVAWGDLDGDGKDDLVIGSGKGGQLAVYHNNGRGGFERVLGQEFDRPVSRDQTSVLLWGGVDHKSRILAGPATYEDDSNTNATVLSYDRTGEKLEEIAGPSDASVGPILLGDLDGDGTLDLFVGGRVIPGRYPESASSRILRGKGGKFVLDAENTRILEQVGLVSGAVMSDLDGDGFAELILACEWGPIRIFHNDHGRLSETNFPISFLPSSTINSQPPVLRSAFAEAGSTLNQLTGWWNGVAVADLDGDGRMDIIAANWGLNTKYRASPEHPRKIYHGDFTESGTVQTIETYFDQGMDKEVPEREFDAMAAAMPFLRGVFKSHRAYGAASISDVLGEHLKDAKQVSANTFASMVFLNRGDHFEAMLLPTEAQLSPAFAVVVGDFDGDGAEDVFLSQNFFATETQTSRCDAGRGLLLQGDGKGALRPVAGQDSGIMVYGEQRGAAAADYDEDGRLDLVVTQNAASTKLFHNLRAKPGLRVRLAGPPGNPTAVGAAIRLQSNGRFGPAREIHAGSGYWSQDGAIQVMALLPEPMRLWIRWPGGQTNIFDVPSGAREVLASPSQLSLVRAQP